MAILKIEPNVVDSVGNFVFNSANVTANITTGNLFVGNTINANGQPITNVGTPISSSDAATKNYVDSALSGISATSISDGDSNITVTDSGVGNIVVTVDNTTASYFTANGFYTKGLFWAANGQVISTGGGGGGGASITMSDTAPTSPASGDLWLDTTTSRFYTYYNDGDSNQWIGLNPNFSVQNNASVTRISDTAPTSPINGDLWFNSSDGKFYIYYNDGDSNQWVALNPVLNLSSNFSIDLLSDVDTTATAPTNGQALMWDSANSIWKPQTVTNPNPNRLYDSTSSLVLSNTGANLALTLNNTVVSLFGDTYIKVPVGTTATRPVSPQIGMIRYNSTFGTLEQYNTNGWELIGGNPSISSISPTAFNGSAGTVITVNGGNFQSGAYVKFIGNTGVVYSASLTSVISNTVIQAVTPALSAIYKPYSVQVVNPNGSSATLAGALDSGGGPAWSTAATLATIYDSKISSVSFTVTAVDPDGQTVTYAATTALPTGLSLNSATGQITGSLTSVASDTTWSFTIAATDSVGNSNSRTFNLLQKAPVITTFTTVGTTSWTAPSTITAVQVLVVAGGGAGGTGSASGGGGGGAGGGVIYDPAFVVTPNQSYTVTVGDGGLVSGTSKMGGNSVFSTYTVYGGGFGGNVGFGGNIGGSGGGAGGSTSVTYAGGTSITAYGTSGGANFINASAPAGGGGGSGSSGAAAATTVGGLGGTGRSINITGSYVYYAAGGGGGALASGTAGAGGIGGGGNGGNSAVVASTGTTNTGGGGGGGGTGLGGAGGTGVVIIRY